MHGKAIIAAYLLTDKQEQARVIVWSDMVPIKVLFLSLVKKFSIESIKVRLQENVIQFTID
jgi:hypothetical protein